MEEMIVRRLELEDFLSYREALVEFPEGSIAIVGENGAGKSSILDAIYFALYRDAGRGSLSSLVRRGAVRAVVRLEFEAGGRSFLVEREIRCSGRSRASSSAKLYELRGTERRLLAYSPSQVDEEIRRILGMDRQMFLTAVYVRQGEISRLLDVDPHQRKRLIAKLLGIEELEKAYTNMALLIKHFELLLEREKSKLAGIERLREQLERITGEEAEVKRRIAEVERRLGRASKELKRVGESILSIEEELAELERATREAAGLREKVAVLKHRLLELEELLSSAEAAQAELREVKRLLRCERVAEEYSRLLGELELEKRRLREYKAELKELENAARRVSELSWVEEIYEELLKLRREWGRLKPNLEAKTGELRALEDEIEGLVNKCEEILGIRPPIKNLVEIIQRELGNLRSKVRSLREKIEAVNSEFERVRATRRQLESWEARLREAGSKCPLCGAPLSESEKKVLLDSYRARIEDLKIREVKLAHVREALKADLERAEQLLAVLASVDIPRTSRLVERLVNLRQECGELNRSVSSLESRLRSLGIHEISVSAIDAKLRELEELRAEMLSLKRYV
ncbi:MAG TPA: hypothetical protein ENG30_00700, partial [Thermofilaceae archaeon]|nr:hypothetical protein [Thermofilaceae archaeon]